MSLILAIDFDGVIHDQKPPEGKVLGAPIEGAQLALKKFKDKGHTIIIHSVWGNRKHIIGPWMKYFDIPYDDITNIKPDADFYIDNKAIHFTSWNQENLCL